MWLGWRVERRNEVGNIKGTCFNGSASDLMLELEFAKYGKDYSKKVQSTSSLWCGSLIRLCFNFHFVSPKLRLHVDLMSERDSCSKLPTLRSETLASGVRGELLLATRNWITPTSSKLANNLEKLMKSLALAADSGESTRWITYLRLWGRNPLPTPDNLKRQSIVSRARSVCVWWRKTNCDMKGKGIVIKMLKVYCRQAWTVEDRYSPYGNQAEHSHAWNSDKFSRFLISSPEQKLFFENDLCLASLLQVIFYSKHKFRSFYKSLSGAYLEIKP